MKVYQSRNSKCSSSVTFYLFNADRISNGKKIIYRQREKERVKLATTSFKLRHLLKVSIKIAVF